MDSEGTTAGSAVARLAAVLSSVKGADPSTEDAATPRELAELLWFAAQLIPEGQERQEEPTASGQAAPAGHARQGSTDTPPTPTAVPPRPDPPHPNPHQPSTPPPDTRIPLHLPEPPHPDAPTGPGRGTPLLAPAPPMLPRPLALQRALRPLKRKVPAPRARLLDEHATADRIARLGAHPNVWFPVLRPAPDRWLRLNLVYDAGPTMPVWRPLVRELHTVLAQSGIFRTVTAHRATPDGRALHVPALADGRTVTLVVSDCMGPQWRPGPAGDRWYRALRRWASRMPLAVVQPLPEHLWPTTALPAAPGLLTAPTSAAPSAALTFTPYDAHDPHTPHEGAVPLPVLEPAPTWLANWAALIAAPGGGHAPGALAWLPPAPLPPAEPAPGVSSLPAQDLVLRFRATASPEAFRIAGHLALANPSLPVMRLVQRALDRSPRPQHLAEIILSGMLTALEGPPGSYEFRPGVRELLLRSLPRTARARTREFLARVGGLIDERAGLAAGEFRAEVRREAGGDGGTGPAFATVSAETIRRLGGEPAEELVGGRYRLLGQRGPNDRMWAAVDVRTDRPVVVHLYPPQRAPQERFRREARVLAELRHPNVVRVLDHGVEDERPYLVAEFVDGVTVAELQNGSGPGVSFRVHARLASDVVPALEALHERGLVRGQSGWDGLLLRPDGSVVISRFALGEQSEGRDGRSDLVRFGSLLKELAAHSPVSLGFQRMQAELAWDKDPVDAIRRLPRSIALGWAQGGIDADRLRVTMLGPLDISCLGRLVTLPSPRAQALLCMLLLRPGRRVGHAELAAGLWEEPLPRTEALHRLARVAGEIHACLGPGTLAELSDGYAVHVPDDYIDVHHCEELLADRTDDMDPQLQRALVRDALGLFYGDPLDGLPGPAATATRDRLRALRLDLRTLLAQLDLKLGTFRQAAADLADLVREHPDREDLRRLHVMALKNLGRLSEAIKSYETYAELRQLRPGDPVDPALQELYHELRTAPRLTIGLEIDGRGTHPEAHHALGRATDRVLKAAQLRPHQFEVLARDNGYVVLTEPDAAAHGLVSGALLHLPVVLAELDDPPRFRVTFWHTPFAGADESAVPSDVRAALETVAADITVVVSPELHAELAGSAFLPLHGDTPGSAPLAWYCPLSRRAAEPDVTPRDLVRGPFTTPDLSLLASDAGRTAIVHTQPDGPLTLLDPARPRDRRRPLYATYYEVDLTTHRATCQDVLPSSGGGAFAASVKFAWQVADPVAYVLGEPTHIADALLDHVLSEASRVTRRYPLRRARAAQRAVEVRLGRWPVPGLSVTCSVRLAAGAQPNPAPPGPSSGTPSPLADLLRSADAVILGFDGTLTRLFGPDEAHELVRDLARHVGENRHPDDTLAEQPLLPGAGPVRAEDGVTPIALLRTLAGHPAADAVRTELNRKETWAARTVRPTPFSDELVHTLYSRGMGLAVVTDHAASAAETFLDLHGLTPCLLGGVHGRSSHLTRLMPHPGVLLRAVERLGASRSRCVLIGSTLDEQSAAHAAGMRFIGHARTEEARRRFDAADLTVPGLRPILEAAHSL
ncbi:DNA-binding transcriptional activator of the SARP family [Streptomyces sp. cf386]|uniref:SAV_2336 N-terminal domain-related protein n=1 Tax=Streptomyces sp. cf386 TaxID=1761904 RepID=UPI0008817D95|nr:SAV_2336 N-terminal domain-related protein [Streptomyces sp. cf386]SDO92256.1 DNA-binding transcriptional activator of the SARP family [Streptomyces sp. cf386]